RPKGFSSRLHVMITQEPLPGLHLWCAYYEERPSAPRLFRSQTVLCQKLSVRLLAKQADPVGATRESLNKDSETAISHFGTPLENLVPNRVDYLDFIVGRVRLCSHVENKERGCCGGHYRSGLWSAQRLHQQDRW